MGINAKAVTAALNIDAAAWKSTLNTALAGTGASIASVDSVTAPSAVAANEKASFCKPSHLERHGCSCDDECCLRSRSLVWRLEGLGIHRKADGVSAFAAPN